MKITTSITYYSSMYEISDSDVVIHLCTFEAYFYKAKVNLRFPSLFFVEWKSMNSKNSVAMIGRKRAINSNIDLDETLLFTTEMIFHRGQGQYLKKESLIHLNLISSSRPDEVKLVGRVVIDLSNIANNKIQQELSTFKLMYCSVEADITFKVKMNRCIQSNLHLKQLDKSAFSDLYSFTGPKNGLKLQFKETISEKRKNKYQKEETPSRNGKTHQSGKTDNILIKDHHQEESQDNNMLNSLPLTEKKKGLPPIESTPQFKRAESNQIPIFVPQKPVKPQQPSAHEIKPEVDLKIDAEFYKERDLLERELTQHKNRIKKLQTDIKSAMKMFQQSQSLSQLTKTKLVQSEHALQQLAARQNRIKEEHNTMVVQIRENYEKEIEIIKSGYEADIKILRATLEQEKLAHDELKSKEKNYMQELRILAKKLEENQGVMSELTPLQQQNAALHQQISHLNQELARISQEKQGTDTQLTQKTAQIEALSKENQKLKHELELIKAHKQQANQATVELQQKLSVLQSELDEQRAAKAMLTRALDQLATNYEDKLTKLKEQITNYQITIQRTVDQEPKSTPIIPNLINFPTESINHSKAPQQNSNQTETIVALEQKIVELEKIRESQAVQIAQYEQNIASIRLQCDLKIESLLKQLQNYQNESHRLANISSKNLAQVSPKELVPLDEEAIKRYQQLQQQHQKINEELQAIKTAKEENRDMMRRLCQENQQIKEEKFVLEEKNKLQQIQIDELKQEKATMRQRMQKMHEQYDNLKKNYDNKIAQKLNQEQREAKDLYILEQVKEKVNMASQSCQTQQLQQLAQAQNQTPTEDKNALQIQAHQNNNQEQAVKVIKDTEQQLKIQPAPHIQLYPKTLDERLNSSAENVHERHNYAFEQHLTHQDVNSFRHSLHNQVQEQQVALRDENQRLREELQQLKAQLEMKENETIRIEKQRDEIKSKNTEVIAHLENQNANSPNATISIREQETSSLAQADKTTSLPQTELVDANPQLTEAIDLPAVEEAASAPYSVDHLPSATNDKQQQLNQIILEQQEAYSRLQARVLELQQQVSAVNEQSLLPSERQRQWMKDLESKVESLQEEMKIKDQLLSQSERNLMENYQIKFELADLKDKYHQIQQALQQRDAYISELQETKEFLSKEVQTMQQQSGQRDASHKAFEFKMEKVELTDNNINQGLQEVNTQTHQLKEEIEALGAQLIKLNNQNTELRTSLGDTKNELSKLVIQAKDRQTLLLQDYHQLKNQMQSLKISLAQVQKQKEELMGKVIQKQASKNRNDDEPPPNNSSQGLEPSTLKAQCQIQAQKQVTALQSELSALKAANIGLQAQIQTLTRNNLDIQKSNQDKLNAIDELQTKVLQLQGLLTKNEQQKHALQIQLQETTLKLAQINRAIHQEPNIEKESPTSEKHNKSSISNIVEGMPFLEVHTIESHSEAPPLNYSQDNIIFDQAHERDHLSNNKLQSLNQQIASLKFDLSQEQEQKIIYLIEIKQNKAKIEDLNQQIKHLKEQQDKFSALPLQSFDSNQRFANNLREIITEESKEHEPSILRQILVGAQPRKSTHISNTDSQNQKQNLQTQTRLETNLASLTSEQLESIKREMQIVKQQLQSQKKIHYELQQIHKICKKKYELLETRYQNCIAQLEFYQVQNQSLINNKTKAQHELYRIKKALEEVQKQQKQQTQESATSKAQKVDNDVTEGSKPQMIEVGNITKQDNILNGAATILSGTTLIPQNEVNQPIEPIQPSELIQQYQHQIQTLTKDCQQFKMKTLILQENIQSLEQSLQQQIQLQQTNEKLLSKLQTLNELQSMAAQFQLERQQLQKQNEDLKKVKAEYQSLVAEKTDLNKMFQEQRQWENQKKLWENKLSQIEEMVLLKQSQYNAEKSSLEQKINTLQQQLERRQLLQCPTATNETTESPQNKASEQYLAREQHYIQQLTSARAEKLEQLQKVVNLEEKINAIESANQQRLFEFQESLTLRQNQLEQLRFAHEQLQRELQQHKAALDQLHAEKENTDHFIGDYNLLQQNYRLVNEELNATREQLERYVSQVKDLEEAGAKLQRLIEQLQQEKWSAQDMQKLKDEILKLHQEIANKSANVEELEVKNKQLQQNLDSLVVQLEEQIATIHAKEQEIDQITIDRAKIKAFNEQLTNKIQSIQQKLSQINQTFANAQARTVTLTAQAQSHQQSIQTLQQQLHLRTAQLSTLHSKLSSKELNLIQISKQLDNQRLMSQRSEQKIKMLSEKEKEIKETLTLVESQSRKIVEALKQRYKSQEAYYNRYLQKDKECARLLTTAAQIAEEISIKDRLLEHQQLKADKLQSEIDLLKKQNSGLLPTDSQGFAVEYSKYQKLMATNDQLMLKNRQYLQKLSEKSTINSQNERLKSQLKSMSATLSHINSQYSHFKSQHQSNNTILLSKLKNAEQKNEKQAQRLSQLQQELSDKKQKDMKSAHVLYDSLIGQKNQEIEALRTRIYEIQKLLSRVESSVTPKEEIKQQINHIEQRNLEEAEDHFISQQIQVAQTTHADNQKTLSHNLKQSTGVQTIRNITAQLHGVCKQIKDISEQRKGNEQSLYQAFIQKYDQIEEHFGNLNTETALIQEKARLISKQLQKIKAHIVKSQTKGLKEKTQLLALIKPCETAAGELVALSETLSERDSQSFL